ncbi:lipopolysaccharide-induced tumor necrosis factor-alpha factor homolog isoform X1 [Osmia bicornis bicornis]|uniref:lipopolysaccharide-induced tumor necrosis factor-alpha factor homolog isoform X1 n=2 Tax=Osmia bicornis bicornis TaxID=1437191 RepID=UPI0010F88C30|nr:lipopolysaccharide-induced tumor necrosis factor-alpha factor homolog isoform X1 [Osmia bicornis bicornis]
MSLRKEPDIMSKGMSAPPPPGFVPPPAPPSYHDGRPNVVVIGAPQFDSEPQRLTCPHCHANISTEIQTQANTRTHLFALLLCVTGLWCCAPCPYCIDSCQTKKHYCPACKAYLGESVQ